MHAAPMSGCRQLPPGRRSMAASVLMPLDGVAVQHNHSCQRFWCLRSYCRHCAVRPECMHKLAQNFASKAVCLERCIARPGKFR